MKTFDLALNTIEDVITLRTSPTDIMQDIAKLHDATSLLIQFSLHERIAELLPSLVHSISS